MMQPPTYTQPGLFNTYSKPGLLNNPPPLGNNATTFSFNPQGSTQAQFNNPSGLFNSPAPQPYQQPLQPYQQATPQYQQAPPQYQQATPQYQQAPQQYQQAPQQYQQTYQQDPSSTELEQLFESYNSLLTADAVSSIYRTVVFTPRQNVI